MNASEDLRRIATVVRWIGISLAGVSLAIGVVAGANALHQQLTCTDCYYWDDAAWATLSGAGFAEFFYIGASG